jgi:hypothetical protein
MGFDWHSQVLHGSWRWRRRFSRARARKILYVQESIAASARLSGTDAMAQAFGSAVRLCDAVLYADVADRALVEGTGKPSMWQPFGVDVGLFRAETPFARRAPQAFFRGKVDAFQSELEYAERRRLLEALRSHGLVDVVPYVGGEVDPAGLAADFDRYRIAVNLPSVFAGHTTRVLEGMACGCCVVTNRTGVPEVDGLFRDGSEVAYYSGEVELVDTVRRLTSDGAAAEAIAEGGRRAVAERFSLTRLLDEVLEWCGRVLPGVLPRARRAPAVGSRC